MDLILLIKTGNLQNLILVSNLVLCHGLKHEPNGNMSSPKVISSGIMYKNTGCTKEPAFRPLGVTFTPDSISNPTFLVIGATTD